MKKFVIFDFNRTLFDPESGKLLPKARFVLRTLLRRGFGLFLISRREKSRAGLIKKLKISTYFSGKVFSEEKSVDDFAKLLGSNINRNSGYVVGDRVREEIKIGNILKLKTIWLKSGKFSKETPRTKNETPDFKIDHLNEILRILKKEIFMKDQK